MMRKKIEMLVILLGDEERMRKKIETLVIPSGDGFANHHPEATPSHAHSCCLY